MTPIESEAALSFPWNGYKDFPSIDGTNGFLIRSSGFPEFSYYFYAGIPNAG
jgi:hypothetical protein